MYFRILPCGFIRSRSVKLRTPSPKPERQAHLILLCTSLCAFPDISCVISTLFIPCVLIQLNCSFIKPTDTCDIFTYSLISLLHVSAALCTSSLKPVVRGCGSQYGPREPISLCWRKGRVIAFSEGLGEALRINAGRKSQAENVQTYIKYCQGA